MTQERARFCISAGHTKEILDTVISHQIAISKWLIVFYKLSDQKPFSGVVFVQIWDKLASILPVQIRIHAKQIEFDNYVYITCLTYILGAGRSWQSWRLHSRQVRQEQAETRRSRGNQILKKVLTQISVSWCSNVLAYCNVNSWKENLIEINDRCRRHTQWFSYFILIYVK